MDLSSTDRPTVSNLLAFVNAVPAPLTTVLVRLGPYIATIRQAVDILNWKSSHFDGWLALASWWAICLLAEPTFRYFLPVAILFALAVNSWTARPRPSPSPVTEQTIEAVVSDLIAINALLPPFLSIPTPSISIPTLLRVLAFLYPPYLFLTFLIRLRILTAITGTVLLSWNAPWALPIRHGLWRSAWFRWSLYYTWSFLTGQPLPPLTLSLQPQSTTTLQPTHETRFLFTIYENQRWWVTLDWTPALLPAERPAWCSHTYGAVSPPSAFTLPEPSTVFLTDDKGRRVKRTATWRWEENEWKVLVKTQPDQVKLVENSKLQSPDSPSRIKQAKAPANTKDIAIEMQETGASSSKATAEIEDVAAKSVLDGESPDPTPEALSTDADGWVYCDNKWERPASVNSLGKFTRYRRWVRVAIVSELVETVNFEGTGITSGDAVISAMPHTPAIAECPESADATTEDGASLSNPAVVDGDSDPSQKRGSLRQRMQRIAS